jgi:hypothetical protein
MSLANVPGAVAATAIGLWAALAATGAHAWGATGHAYVTGLAMEALDTRDDGVPAFLRTPEAIALAADLSREPDRSRGAGQIHGAERDPAHYINADEDGSVQGVTPFSGIARTREDFDTALRGRGLTQYKAGYLPYAIVDGWQQLAKNLAFWRAFTALIEAADTTPELRAWATAERRTREMLTIRDLGVWSHYVGDASQPLHTTRHFDGWGPYPNPRGFTQALGMHWRLEGPFVRRNVTRATVASAMRPYKACNCPFEVRVSNYLGESRGQVRQTFELEGEGAFAVAKSDGPPPAGPVAPNDPVAAKGAEFLAGRLAAAASELRDMVEDAWRASLDGRVGFPEVAVRAIIAKPSVLTPEVIGVD